MSTRLPQDWDAFCNAGNSLRAYTRKLREDFESHLTQLLSVLDDWTRAILEGYNTDVYFDFSKAFNTVPHKQLTHKLKIYNIDGKLLEWLQHFISDRLKRVIINSTFSSVPQGNSILGTLLFAIYVNDLPSIVSSILSLFADDLLDNKPLATSTCVKDLGIWIDDKLKFHEHTSVTIAKTNFILAIIKQSFNVNMNTFLRL